MIKFKWSGTFKMMGAIDADLKNMDKRARQAADDVALALINDVRASWSAKAPSDPGKPPAVVTGRLDRSGRIERRGGGGRFSGVDAASTISVRWAAYNDEGEDYASLLEYGDGKIAARPFLRPAIERMRPHALNIFKGLLS